MMSLPKKNLRARLATWVDDKRELFQDEVRLASRHRVLHFLYLIYRNFDDNRCLSRAGAMTFSTILAIVPTLAIVLSYAPNVDDEVKRRLITAGIEYFAPTLDVDVKQPSLLPLGGTNSVDRVEKPSSMNASTNDIPVGATDVNGGPDESGQLKKQIVDGIIEFTQNFEAAKFGVFGSIAFLGMVFSTLVTIESVMNDIWESDRGRPWPARLMSYWVVISLSGILFAGAGLLLGFQERVNNLPGGVYITAFGIILFIALALTVLYRLMPNARVKWLPALVGGVTGAMLLQLNKMFIPLFITSRAVRDGKIFGGFLAVPLFMFGIYIAWVIVLFGAQVAASFQNRKNYLHSIQSRSIHQYGRETTAFRIMAMAARNFMAGSTPPTVEEMTRITRIPRPLVQESVDILIHHRLLQTTGTSPEKQAVIPARPVETISCFDIIDAMRRAKGQNLESLSEHRIDQSAGADDEMIRTIQHIRELDQANCEKITLKELISTPAGTATA